MAIDPNCRFGERWESWNYRRMLRESLMESLRESLMESLMQSLMGNLSWGGVG